MTCWWVVVCGVWCLCAVIEVVLSYVRTYSFWCVRQRYHEYEDVGFCDAFSVDDGVGTSLADTDELDFIVALKRSALDERPHNLEARGFWLDRADMLRLCPLRVAVCRDRLFFLQTVRRKFWAYNVQRPNEPQQRVNADGFYGPLEHRPNSTAVTSSDRAVWVTGGLEDYLHDEVCRLDTGTLTWSVAGRLPRPVCRHTVTHLPTGHQSGVLIVAGGLVFESNRQEDGHAIPDCFYTSVCDEHSDGPPTKVPQLARGSADDSDRADHNGNFKQLGQIGLWKPLPRMERPRFDHTAAVFNNLLVVVGGRETVDESSADNKTTYPPSTIEVLPISSHALSGDAVSCRDDAGLKWRTVGVLSIDADMHGFHANWREWVLLKENG